MTSVTSVVSTVRSTARRRRRPGWLTGIGLLTTWAAWHATTGRDVINSGGWSSFDRFWRSAASPELAGEFVRLTAEATVTTGSYALLGTAVSVTAGLVGALVIAELPWESAARAGPVRRSVHRLTRLTLVIPRAVHEVIWALLLIQVLGFDPLVAIIAIGLQFGAVTAKVYGEIIDDADRAATRTLRVSGAGRLAAFAYGTLPLIRRDLVSYGFYRLECAVRSAAVLGIVGAGGLGFQLDLSFESLRYDEIWTLIAALMLLSGLADAWSATVRRTASAKAVRRSWIVGLAALPLAAWYVGLDLTTLWSERTRRLGRDLVGDLVPPRLGPGGWSELARATIDTLAMSVLATSIAAVAGLALATVAARPYRPDAPLARHASGVAVRAILLLFRAVPAPVWAFLVILIMFPGIWPGAIALGIYNAGVLGRLFAEVFEDHDDRARRSLDAAGASPAGSFLYGVLPETARRLTGLAFYRWEVITRETVIVGVVGAAGLGRLIQEHLVARDFAAVLGTIGALVVLTALIDALSTTLRRALA